MQITATGLFGAVIIILILYFIIGFLWATAERLIYGEVRPSRIDDVVAAMLAISIYYNII